MQRGSKRCIFAYIHARYHEKEPKTIAEIANSRARSKVEVARVAKASLDILRKDSGRGVKDEIDGEDSKEGF